MSEAELVSFIHKNGYSIVSNDTKKITITYSEENDVWSLNIRALCNRSSCHLDNCEGLMMCGVTLKVSGPKEDPKLEKELPWPNG